MYRKSTYVALREREILLNTAVLAISNPELFNNIIIAVEAVDHQPWPTTRAW